MSIKSHLAVFITAIIFFSCSQIDKPLWQESYYDDLDEECTRIVMEIPPVVLEEDGIQTKVAVELGSTVKYLWSETDTVGIFPTSGCQLFFSMAEGAGQSSTSFDGGGWKLHKDADYYSYYPFVPDYYIDKNAIPISYLGQSQKGNADPSRATLGPWCYMVAKGEYDEERDIVNFVYQRLGSLFRIRIPVEPGTYESLAMVIGDDLIASSGTYKAIDIDQVIYAPVLTNNITLKLEDVTFDESGILVAYIMTSPFNILNTQLTFNLTKSTGEIVTASGFGKNYVATMAYGYAPNISVTPTAVSEIPGEGGTFEVRITASGASTYAVSTDAEWLTLGSNPTSGSATIAVTAAEGSSSKRTGHVIISEDVTYQGTTITLQNVVTVTQDIYGSNINDWEQGENIEDEI